MKKILFWVWQFPQNIIGYILAKNCTCGMYYLFNTKVYIYHNFFKSAVSLGDYIIFDRIGIFSEKHIKHEFGHTIQSRLLGPLYLIVIGLPSIVFNIYDRLAHKHWTALRRYNWYYSLPWEAWADKLAGVKR